jgi:hypothetical protein
MARELLFRRSIGLAELRLCRAVPSKFDAVIVFLLMATAALAFEDRNRSEISPQPASTAFVEAASNPCAAAIAEYQSDATRRMTMMAFGIAVPERRRSGSALAFCAEK